MPFANILIADKNKELAEIAKKYLESFGYSVDLCCLGKDAKEMLNKKNYDVIVCDVELADLKGFDLKDLLKGSNENIPFIFTSEYADIHLLLRMLRESVHSFLLKPYSLETLKEVVDKVVETENLKKEILNLKVLLSLNIFEMEIGKSQSIEESLSVLKTYITQFTHPDVICWLFKEVDKDPFREEKSFECKLYRYFKLLDEKFSFDGMSKYVELKRDELSDGEFTEMIIYLIPDSESQYLAMCVANREREFSLIEKNAFFVIMNYYESFYRMYAYKLKLEQSYFEIVDSLAKTLEARDEYTGKHTESVQKVALKIAEKLELSEKEKEILEKASRLHDIGKIGISDSILLKPGKLTPEEYEEIKKHPSIGYEILSKSDSLKEVAKVVLHHHEWYSGQGYPYGFKGDEIPLLSRILCLADAYHALISDRPYRKAFSKQDALKILKEEAGIKFDPKLVEILEELVASGQI